MLGSPVAGIIGRFLVREGERVEEGAVIVELRRELEDLEVARRKAVLDAALRALERTQQLRRTTRTVSDEELEQAQLQHDVAESEYRVALADQRQREIAAPFGGIVTSYHGLEVGESVQLQSSVARVVDASRCLFVSHIDGRLAHTVAAGRPVTLVVEPGTGPETFEGEIVFVSPVIDPASGLLEIRAEFDNSDGRIRPGLPGTMRWSLPATAEAR